MSSILYAVGTILILHAAYSSLEFHQILKSVHHLETTSVAKIPTDIIHETIYGIVLIIVGAVISVKNGVAYAIEGRESDVEGLKDININAEIKQDDEYLKPIEMKRAVELAERIGTNDYEVFSNRVDFIDIVQKRKEYSEWLEKNFD